MQACRVDGVGERRVAPRRHRCEVEGRRTPRSCAFLTDSFKVLSMTLVIVSSIARAVAAICFQEVVMTKMMSAAAAAYLRYSEGFMTCVDIKVQAPFNSWSLAVGARCCSLDTVACIARRSCPSLGRKHESRDSLVDFHAVPHGRNQNPAS